MFSPDEIDKIKFARTIYGYSPLEVDEFLEHIKRQAEELCRENSTLRKALGDARFDSSKLRLELLHAKDENVGLLGELDALRCGNDSLRTELEKVTYEAASVSDAPAITENAESKAEDEGTELYDASELMSADIRDEAAMADVTYAEDEYDGEGIDDDGMTPPDEENSDIPANTDEPDEADSADDIDIIVGNEIFDNTDTEAENVTYINEPDDEYGEDEVPTGAVTVDSEELSDFDEFFSDFNDADGDDGKDDDEVIDYSGILGVQKNDSDEPMMAGKADGAGEPESVGAAAPIGSGETSIDEIYLDIQKMLDEWDKENTAPAQEQTETENDNVEISDFDSLFRLEKEEKDGKDDIDGKLGLGSFASEPQGDIETETVAPEAEVTPKGYKRRKYHIRKKSGVKESAGEKENAAPDHDRDNDQDSNNENGTVPQKNDGDDEDADILAALKSEYDAYNYFFGDGKK